MDGLVQELGGHREEAGPARLGVVARQVIEVTTAGRTTEARRGRKTPERGVLLPGTPSCITLAAASTRVRPLVAPVVALPTARAARA